MDALTEGVKERGHVGCNRGGAFLVLIVAVIQLQMHLYREVLQLQMALVLSREQNSGGWYDVLDTIGGAGKQVQTMTTYLVSKRPGEQLVQ